MNIQKCFNGTRVTFSYDVHARGVRCAGSLVGGQVLINYALTAVTSMYGISLTGGTMTRTSVCRDMKIFRVEGFHRNSVTSQRIFTTQSSRPSETGLLLFRKEFFGCVKGRSASTETESHPRDNRNNRPGQQRQSFIQGRKGKLLGQQRRSRGSVYQRDPNYLYHGMTTQSSYSTPWYK